MKVLITGGRSGIGMALAERQTRLGNEVVVTASSQDGVESVRALYAERNITAHVVPFALDPSIPLFDEFNAVLSSGVDALVLNAAPPIKRFKYVHDLQPEEIREAFTFQVEGNLRLIRAVLPQMMDKRFGRLVFVSSAMVTAGTSRHGLYCMTKSAMEALFLNLCVDYSRQNILSNVVRPGIVKTDRTRRFWKRKAYLEKAEKLIPQGRLGEPEEIATAFDPLLAQTSYITGSIITVSGGLPLMQLSGIQ